MMIMESKPEKLRMDDILKIIMKQIDEDKKESNEKPKKNNKKKNDIYTEEESKFSEKDSIPKKPIFELLKIANKNITSARQIFYEIMNEDKFAKGTEFLTKFIESTNHILTIKSDLKTEVFIYKEGIYVPNGICELKEQLRELLGSGFFAKYYSPIIEKILSDTMIEQKEFIKKVQAKENISLLPVANGIFDLTNHKLRPFSPNHIFLNKLPIEYNPQAKCPTIEKHFKEVLNEEDDKLIYEIFGFSLWKDYFIEKAIIFVGGGRNAKGKSMELFKSLLGHDNCCSVPLSEFKEGDFSISELFGKMVNLAGDLSNTALKDTGVFKMSVGRDNIGANRKFLPKLHFVNYAKNIFACNELPKVYDNSVGFWERWVLIDFPFTFKEKKEYDKIMDGKDEELKKKTKLMDTEHINKLTTKEEMEGLLLKAIEGLDRIRKNKSFSYTKSSADIKEDWTRKADSFLAFCKDNIESGDTDTDKIRKMNLRKYYHQYCVGHKLKGSSDINIKITLEENYGVSEDRNHNQETFWCGIKFKDNSPYSQSEKIWKTRKEVIEKERQSKFRSNSY